MTQASQKGRQPTLAAEVLGFLANGAAALAAKARRHRAQAHNLRVLSELTSEQLEDCGIDRETASQPRPRIEVKAGLMANLMSLR